jgi:hypothetical protein
VLPGMAAALFEALRTGHQIMNLVGIQLERRQRRMTGFDTFSKGLTESFHRVAQMQGPEWWRDLERALSEATCCESKCDTRVQGRFLKPRRLLEKAYPAVRADRRGAGPA